MLRTLLVGILALTAASSCSSEGDAPVAQPGVAAGKVVELTGTVTATRGSQVRTLAAGGEISSDDVIDTAAGSRVVILVAHNNARWDLGPNKHGKVSESLAWTAAKQEGATAAVIEESSTAGAHAEKSAATTDTTTAEEKSEDKTERARARPAVPAPAKPSAADTQTEGGPPPTASANTVPQGIPSTPTAGGTPPPPPPPPPPRPETSSKKSKMTARAPEQSVAVRDKDEESTQESRKQVAPDATVGSPGPGGTALPPRDPDPVRDAQLEIRGHFARERIKLRACFAPTMPNVLIQITVTSGVYTITTVDKGATAEARACLATIAKTLGSKTKLDKPVSIKLTLAKP